MPGTMLLLQLAVARTAVDDAGSLMQCGHCLGHCPNPKLEPAGGCRFPCETPVPPAKGCCVACNSTAPPPPPPPCLVPPSLEVIGDHGEELLLPPTNGSVSTHASWLQEMRQWRTQCHRDINYTGQIYEVPELKWTQTSYVEPQVHPFDRFFYNRSSHSYTVERFLDDLNDRYGGVDSILLWPTYPMIGADDRNQFDMIRAMPGGVQRLKALGDELHKRGVRSLWPYNPWDYGTHHNHSMSGRSFFTYSLADLVSETDFDGFFGDTMGGITEDFYLAGLTRHNQSMAMEPEAYHLVADFNWMTLGWGYWQELTAGSTYTGKQAGGPYPGSTYPHDLMVDKWKWLDGRRMTHVCNRNSKNHTDEIQAAWINGVGIETWENVWSVYNKIVPRDGEMIRRMATMMRFLGGKHGFFANLGWVPRVPVLQSKEIFASFFPRSGTPSQHAEQRSTNGDIIGDAVWTFINRDIDHDATGLQIELDLTQEQSVEQFNYYDCYHGKQLQPTPTMTATTTTLSFPIEAGGIGCLLRLGKQSTTIKQTDLANFLGTMTKLTAGKPLRSYSREWSALQQTLVSHKKTMPPHGVPEGMVLVPPGVFHFSLKGVGHEGSAQVQFPWESVPSVSHDHTINVTGGYGKGLYVDKFPVTCSQYAAYLRASRFYPSDPYNWLKNWNHSSAATDPTRHELHIDLSHGSTGRAAAAAGEAGRPVPPDGYAKKPVTYVSFAEAENYCRFYGKRLPEAWEFQYFATGGKRNYSFPWGTSDDLSRYPQPGMIYLPNGTTVNHNHYADTIPGPADVDLFENGSSPFNVSDLIGNVWQYTSRFEDDHTAGVITQGSCNYNRTAFAPYYFTRAKTLQEHNKWFLFDDSWERCGTIGFRCVSDINQ